MAPKVSILTPVYNRADYLPTAIESVLAQTMMDWELIISDNLSTDGSTAIAQRYAAQDSRIHYHKNEEHVTAVENFNLCYHRSHPESTYIALLASDDWWEPTFLSRTIEKAEQYPHVAFVHTDMYRTSSDGHILNKYSDLYLHNTPPAGLHQAVPEIFYGTFINIMAAIVSRKIKEELYPTYDFLDNEFKLTPDYDLWVQLIVRGAYGYYIAEPLAYYRKHGDAMTMPERMLPRLESEIRVLDERLEGVIPPELKDVQRDALQQRYASIGFELLTHNRADEAQPHLRQSHLLSAWKRIDVTLARIIASLPCSPACRSLLWRSSLSAARLMGRSA